ncbi:MAG: hypothetical protein NC819_01355 [Candidatus Omnitrophica bacterium]|nr:hypothetical protein [Candidatus Omnitrophota bacterium]
MKKILSLICAGLLAASAATAEETGSFRVKFEPKDPPGIDKPAVVFLVLEKKGEVAPSDQMEVVLQLPPGVQAPGEGWIAREIPFDEETGGVWTVFEWSGQIRWVEEPAGQRTWAVRIPAVLKVLEEGTNWVITARARFPEDPNAKMATGVLFATVQPGAESLFHTEPIPNALAQTTPEGDTNDAQETRP